MKYCSHCRHLNAGRPRYCQYCGHTFNVKLCPRGHINLPENLVCGECGSHDLTEPAPLPRKIRVAIRTFKVVLVILIALILYHGSESILEVIITLLFFIIFIAVYIYILKAIIPSPLDKAFSIVTKILKMIFKRSRNI